MMTASGFDLEVDRIHALLRDFGLRAVPSNAIRTLDVLDTVNWLDLVQLRNEEAIDQVTAYRKDQLALQIGRKIVADRMVDHLDRCDSQFNRILRLRATLIEPSVARDLILI